MDFVLDRTGEVRVFKCLTIIDDATHEAVSIQVERARYRSTFSRGLPKAIRTDKGKAFCGKAMVAVAHGRGGDLRLIEPCKPASIESQGRRWSRVFAQAA